jgi:hypothetical protein
MTINVSFRILNTNSKESSLLVRYWTDTITENVLATSIDVNGDIMLTPNGWPISTRTDYNLNIYNSDYSYESILENIKNACPISFFMLNEKPVNEKNEVFSNISNIVGVTQNIQIETDNNNTIIPSDKLQPNIANIVISILKSNKIL